MSVSAVILTKNEEKNIVDCIDSLKWCDEIILVDDNSEDRTIELAEKAGVKVFKRLLNNDFSGQRNYGLLKAKNDWVLFVDADERVPEALASEIFNFSRGAGSSSAGHFSIFNSYDGFYIKRTDYMWEKELKHGETGNIKLLRLAKRGKGKWRGRVHERWEINGKIGDLKNPIMHSPHQTIKEFLNEINFYTDLRAEELYNQKVKSNWFYIIFYIKAKFFQNYFIKLGILDGIEGFILAMLMSFHSFLVRGKLWLLWHKK